MMTDQPTAPDRSDHTVPPARQGAPLTESTTPPVEGTTSTTTDETSTQASEPARRMSQRAMRWVIGISIAAAVIVAVIGFVGSYGALRTLAEHQNFGWFAVFFPIGVDAGIVGMYGLDLLLVWLRMPKALPRLIAHVLTAATILFNAAAAEGTILSNPLGAGMHAILPLLFVAGVETARHLVIRLNQLSRKTESDQVPLHRWILAPWSAWRTYRRMRLRGISSYARVVGMDRELDVYEAWLKHTHGKGWRKKAGATALLPFKLAPYGLSVEEALDQPRRQQEAADRRAADEADRKAAAAAEKRTRELDAKERDADAGIREKEIEAKVVTAEHEISAKKAAAKAHAKTAEAVAIAQADTAQHTAVIAAEVDRRKVEHEAKEMERAREVAERVAQRVEEAEKTAEEKEAEARVATALAAKATAERKTAEEQASTAKALEEAAVSRRRAKAEEEAMVLEEGRRKVELAQQEEEEARAKKVTAEALADAAILRELAARKEQEAVEAEDIARMSVGERADRKVARMILAAHTATPEERRPETPDMYAVTLEQIQDALGISSSLAGRRREAAIQLIADGYTG
ncbi:DUF2637 domain-containing protein [Streptomyces hydrogenans]